MWSRRRRPQRRVGGVGPCCREGGGSIRGWSRQERWRAGGGPGCCCWQGVAVDTGQNLTQSVYPVCIHLTTLTFADCITLISFISCYAPCSCYAPAGEGGEEEGEAAGEGEQQQQAEQPRASPAKRAAAEPAAPASAQGGQSGASSESTDAGEAVAGLLYAWMGATGRILACRCEGGCYSWRMRFERPWGVEEPRLSGPGPALLA